MAMNMSTTEVFSSSEDGSDCDDSNRSTILYDRSRTLTSLGSSQFLFDTTCDIYIKACELLKITPAQCFIRNITHTEINLSHRSLGTVGVRAISIALLKNTCVTKLNLEDNDIGGEGMKCVSAIFEENYFITDLNVANNHFKLKGAEHLAKTLSFSNTLKKLDVSGNEIEDRGVQLIAESLNSNYTLETLGLSNNNVTETGAAHIQNTLDGNLSLRELNLAWNLLRCGGAVEIAKALRRNSTLRSLDLSWNGLGDEGAKVLLEALGDNTNLSFLNISSNRIGDAGGMAIKCMIKRNESLKHIDITMNPISKSIFIEIIETRISTASSQLNKIVFRDKTFASDENIARVANSAVETLQNFEVCLEHIKVKDNIEVIKWKEKHRDDLCEKFLAYVRGRRLKMMDIFQKFGANGDLVLSVNKFLQGMNDLKKEMKLSDWEVNDLAQYFQDQDGKIHYSYLSSL